MEYQVEDLSPVKKKLCISYSGPEVDESIQKALQRYAASVRLDGFRKGKAPVAVIEKRFKEQVYHEVRQELVNSSLDQALKELHLTPVSGLTLGEDLSLPVRGSDFSFCCKFEVLPDFELPEYQDMEVEQEMVHLDEQEMQNILERVRQSRSSLNELDSGLPPKDGEVANIDFEAFEDGKPISGLAGKAQDLEVGKREALEDLETLVRSMRPGDEKEGEIHFPDDFQVKDLAGKTVTMKVRLNSVKERILPELDDELAKGMGYADLGKLREALEDTYTKSQEARNRAAAQQKLLDRLLEMTDFALPPSMVETSQSLLLNDLATRLARQGQSLEAQGKSIEDWRREMQPKAEEMAKSQVLLQSIAKKEGLTVNDQELNLQIYQNSLRNGQDFRALRQEYERSGALELLRERLLADKAMDFVYSKAKVTQVQPESKTEAAEQNG